MDHRKESRSAQHDKGALRTRLRASWSSADVRGVEASVLERLLALPAVVAAHTVAVYDALPGEIPTDLLRRHLADRGVRVLLPVLLDDDSLAWRVASPSSALVEGRRGTREPAADSAQVALGDADVVVVPGVGYDARGGRLGRGGGSYDRALAGVRDDALVVGVALDDAVVDAIPMETHDRPVHVVVTPTRVISAAPTGC